MKLINFLIILIFLTGCQQAQNQENDRVAHSENQFHAGGKLMSEILSNKLNIKDIPEAKWQELSEKRIFFGHQSVGFNIIDGIYEVLKENPQIKLKIIEEKSPSELAFFSHLQIGTNEDPRSKTDDFVAILKSGLGENTDIAFHKYCYLDVNNSLSSQELFENYKEQIDQISEIYPNLKLVHFTMPLTEKQTGPKAWIKKILGKKIGGVQDNVKRNEYNELLKKYYQKSNLIFDLAAVEALRPDGKYQSFEINNRSYLSMYSGYTNDGGHLNEDGRKRVAEKLLVFLAQII